MSKFHFSKEVIAKNAFAKAANAARLANCADFVYNGRVYSFFSCVDHGSSFIAEFKTKKEVNENELDP